MGNYWAFRTDSENRDYFYSELKEGRLRQGWGYDVSQDLNTIRSCNKSGKFLNADQIACWRGNRKMHPNELDSIQVGDIIITPNLPDYGKWLIAEVTGGYSFKRNHKSGDYGHVLEVKLLTGDSFIHPHNIDVSAFLRGTMKTPMRLWNIRGYKSDIDKIVNTLKRNEDLSQPTPIQEKLFEIKKLSKLHLEKELKDKYNATEFEAPIFEVLKMLYGHDKVEKHAGPKEKGADFISNSNDALGVLHRNAIQVKMWFDEISAFDPLDQIELAYNSHEKIDSGIVITMGTNMTDAYKQREIALSKKLHIPIHTTLKDETLELFLKYLPDLI